MITFQKIILLSYINVINYANFSDYCGETTSFGLQGSIKYISTDRDNNSSCNWIIPSAKDTITTLRILKLNFSSNSTCLSIRSFDDILINLCSNDVPKPVVLSSRNKLSITLKYNKPVYLWLKYSSRINTECGDFDFQCLDRSGCYNSKDICRTGDFVCTDHSDSTGCGICNSSTALCSNISFDRCFDPFKNRCDGIINCPKGEDEINCSESCPQLIKCPNEEKCLKLNQICNFVADCLDGYDEKHCVQETYDLTSIFIITMYVICTVCCTLIACSVFRWLINRNRRTRNALDYALRHFEGDNQSPSNNELYDSDFTSGGTVYEHYIEAVRQKERSCRSSQSKEVPPSFPFHNLDGENELVVLASLSVPTEMCIGLTLSESSKESIKTLKSVKFTGEYSSSYELISTGRNSMCSNSSSERTFRVKEPASSMPSTSFVHPSNELKNFKSFPLMTRRRLKSKNKKIVSFGEAEPVRKQKSNVSIEIEDDEECFPTFSASTKSYIEFCDRNEKKCGRFCKSANEIYNNKKLADFQWFRNENIEDTTTITSIDEV